MKKWSMCSLRAKLMPHFHHEKMEHLLLRRKINAALSIMFLKKQ